MKEFKMNKFLKNAIVLIILVIAAAGIFNFKWRQKEEFPNVEKAERPADISPEEWKYILALHEEGKSSNADIEFHGKVIDQDGEPIAGATITIEVVTYVESLKAQLKNGGDVFETTTHVIKSDADGRIYLGACKGRMLEIQNLSKEGYLCPVENLESLGYDKILRNKPLPTRDKPMILKLYRRSLNGVTLTPREVVIYLSSDNTETAVDLVKGEVRSVTTTDMTVSMWADTFVPGKKYDWTVTVNCRDGGIVVADDDVGMYEAPADGYTSSVTWNFESESATWSPRIDRQIYLKGRGGSLYAAIRLTLRTFHTGRGTIEIHYVYNTNGSRILEHEERL